MAGSWSWLRIGEACKDGKEVNAAFPIVSSRWSKTFGARQAKSKEEERNKECEGVLKLSGASCEAQLSKQGWQFLVSVNICHGD